MTSTLFHRKRRDSLYKAFYSTQITEVLDSSYHSVNVSGSFYFDENIYQETQEITNEESITSLDINSHEFILESDKAFFEYKDISGNVPISRQVTSSVKSRRHLQDTPAYIVTSYTSPLTMFATSSPVTLNLTLDQAEGVPFNVSAVDSSGNVFSPPGGWFTVNYTYFDTNKYILVKIDPKSQGVYYNISDTYDLNFKVSLIN